jgi:hypothetical protein
LETSKEEVCYIQLENGFKCFVSSVVEILVHF